MKKRMAIRGVSGLAALILAVLLFAACSPAAAPQTRPEEEAAIAEETADTEESGPAVEAAAGKSTEVPSAGAELHGGPGENPPAEETGETEEAEKLEGPQETEEAGPAVETGTGQAAAGSEKPSPEMLCFGLPADFDPASVPAAGRDAWADINDDVPFFTEKEMEDARSMAAAASAGAGEPHGYQIYGPLDELGRCTGACALVGTETLPREERGNIPGKPACFLCVCPRVSGPFLLASPCREC